SLITSFRRSALRPISVVVSVNMQFSCGRSSAVVPRGDVAGNRTKPVRPQPFALRYRRACPELRAGFDTSARTGWRDGARREQAQPTQFQPSLAAIRGHEVAPRFAPVRIAHRDPYLAQIVLI